VFNQWDALKKKFDEVNEQLMSQSLDSNKRTELQKHASLFSTILSCHEALEQTNTLINETQQQLEAESDSELKQMFEQELEELKVALVQQENDLEEALYPPDDIAVRSAYLEIRAGAGGQEASLFVADLLKMYMHYAEKHNWKIEIVSESMTDLKGYKEVIAHIKGKNVFGALQKESGVHRVQRVPETETAGRVHTSTATVAVLPEAQEVDVSISPSDLRIDVFRASGAGGQHVNTTDSAVRITHIPSGVVVSCQDERSQHKNKARAMKVLQSRLLAHAEEERHAKESKDRKSQIGTGQRSEKIRTYNYPQNRVTDHQVNFTLKKLDMVMMGDLDEIIQALQKQSREQRQNVLSMLDDSQ
jgi:peptide chain release factor 1